jgi:hypothetical protein
MGQSRPFHRVACVAIVLTGSAAAQVVPDRIRNVEMAAAQIAAIQNKAGANGAFAAIDACYKREFARAVSLTPELEGCMTQDIIVSDVTAVLYASLSAEARRLARAPEPGTVTKAMTQRVAGTFARFKVPEADARAFIPIVRTNGMEAYSRARYRDQSPAKKQGDAP